MTENEKRILTLLRHSGPMTKPELCEKGLMGWATVVKLTRRLQEAGLVETTGSSKRRHGQGRNAQMFNLSDTTPLAIGMDVEYNDTRIVLTDLRGEILARSVHKTPRRHDEATFRQFLTRVLRAFLSRTPTYGRLVGIGVGIPGIGMPSWVKHNKDNSTDLSLYLEEKLGHRVSTDINVRVYTVFEKWDNRVFSFDDFMLVSIRTGIGSGIFVHGNILLGHQEHAGEIGHMAVAPRGRPCVCGRTGCLQTAVNHNQLCRDYYQHVLKQPMSPEAPPTRDILIKGLAELFSRAAAGESSSRLVLKRAARYLGEALASSIMILNLPHIIISGHFGPDGAVWLPFLQEEIRKRILDRMEFSLAYRTLDDDAFTLGAALLILRDYFTGLPSA